ncbi:MAG: UDP-N-acetylmuramoyl-L-alanyl-D-glutamate--2,6-diaminopimelate ligase [Rhodospirillum sp.]|nr:UDP-N-acetylmuramoyl-L-alanyl-D-glutamate--2,6-diaminopimelate ligase [Rhodospirillum sp.]MCF8488797.1 UDP-N-acetylmuramoyl-L-alanyl-D-glutamate--2,6-diaminopimelate ligase [Rhodospirillum sp.]
MQLDKILTGQETPTVRVGGWDNREIKGVTADSREVAPGWLFAALPGVKVDGAAFISDALRAGAAVILAAPGTTLPTDAPDGTILLTDPNPRKAFTLFVAASQGNAQPETVAAVTGTNGKTSTVTFARQLWDALGLSGASMGTIGAFAKGYDRPGRLTTPDPVTLHRLLAELAAAGATHLALEASSHGLDQYRLDGARIQAAAFTNLSRDHLDYHGDMARYLAAKTRLFTEVLAEGGTAVLNADGPEFPALSEVCRNRGLAVLSFGHGAADLAILDRRPQTDGQDLTLSLLGERRDIHLPLAGDFQAMNVLCALGLVLATTGMNPRAFDLLPSLTGVPGRMELVATRANGAAVYVDFAHTPDALETVLKALRPHCAGRLVCVFGCGGDRDRGKRPEMGRIAEELADIAIVTDDNPRTEDPATIRAEIKAACPSAREIGDRDAAIREAVALLESGDLLVIAGKGHETGQTVGAVVHPFLDADHARDAVREADQ